jgi:hypothetical protein
MTRFLLVLAALLSGGNTVAAESFGTSGAIRQNINLTQNAFNNVPLPDLVVPPGNAATILVAYDVPVQSSPSTVMPCIIISQLLVDGTRAGLQTLTMLPLNGTVSVRETHVVANVVSGTHKVQAQLYPECSNLSVTSTIWSGGEWGGNYNYLLLK